MTDRIKEREERWRAEAANELIEAIETLGSLEEDIPDDSASAAEGRVIWVQSWLMAYTKRARAIVKLEGLFRP